jgi:bisphosphoglycerate-dependent phosphoglycerate mutase
MTEDQYNYEIANFAHDVSLFNSRVQYFKNKVQMWRRKYDEKCAVIKELEKRLAQYE